MSHNGRSWRNNLAIMFEITGNLHLHTISSDGTGTHDEVASAAARAGLDFIMYTDHNTWVDGVEGWYKDAATGRDVLCLMGQEVNDQTRDPELNHLLCHFMAQNLNEVAADPQKLIDTVMADGGLTFLAHPLERPGYAGAAQVYPWINWEVTGYTGIELWNAMTDVKWHCRTLARGMVRAFLPQLAMSGPFPEVLARWDELLATGRKVVAIGNSDAHAMSFTKFGITRTIYPYHYLFRAVNTHLLLDEPLNSQVMVARQQIHGALSQGHCFVGYDLIGSTQGFRFMATCDGQTVSMGDSLRLRGAATLQIESPLPTHIRLLHNGQLLTETHGQGFQYEITQSGVYRVEAYRRYWGQERGWVFTNPIYVA